MARLPPELLERIFEGATERSCDWAGCRIHAKQNLYLLARVCSQWYDVAKRMHHAKEAELKRLVDSCTIYETCHSVPVKNNGTELSNAHIFSVSTIMEGAAAESLTQVALAITLYGSDTPASDLTIEYLGDTLSPEASKNALISLHFRGRGLQCCWETYSQAWMSFYKS